MTADETGLIGDERAIERALIRFARALDARDWGNGLSEILAEDAAGDFGTGRLEGRAAIIELIRGFLDNCGSPSTCSATYWLKSNGDEATSRTYVQDPQLSRSNPELTFHTLGDYHDRSQRRDGRWWLVERVKDNRGTVGSLGVFALWAVVLSGNFPATGHTATSCSATRAESPH